jgi:hypothetical protein
MKLDAWRVLAILGCAVLILAAVRLMLAPVLDAWAGAPDADGNPLEARFQQLVGLGALVAALALGVYAASKKTD